MRKLSKAFEDSKYNFIIRNFEEYHGITLAFITLNEAAYVTDFLEHIKPYVRKICMVDGESSDNTVKLTKPLVDSLEIIRFNGHYGNQKNRAIELCYTDWVLFLDPDERLTEKVIKRLPSLINQEEYDCISFPRREFIDNVEYKSLYPDYQERLFRAYCRYVRPIHHELVGWKKKLILPMNEDMDILHKKTSKRHSSRNSMYEHLERHYVHEMGTVGCQLEESLEKKHANFFEKNYTEMILEKVRKAEEEKTQPGF